jgi:hypothetical protein
MYPIFAIRPRGKPIACHVHDWNGFRPVARKEKNGLLTNMAATVPTQDEKPSAKQG